jgi:DNA polymerase-3 subunit epsilon
MRQVVLDTETTGLEIDKGHRIIEIGAVELINRRAHREWHCYLNPEREIDTEALAVHGLDLTFLGSKPKFHDIVDEMIDFILGSELIMHNAAFDVAFLNAELGRLGKGNLEEFCTVFDTLKLARELHPGQRNNLDALCKRYGVDNSKRDKHGALMDAQLLAEVYLAMTRGQESLLDHEQNTSAEFVAEIAKPGNLEILYATPEEEESHRKLLEQIAKKAKKGCLWLEITNHP